MFLRRFCACRAQVPRGAVELQRQGGEAKLAKILVVEDDMTLCDVIGELLTRDHHLPEIVSLGDEALLRLKTYSYDLVVLDWELPGLSGVEIMSEFRGRGGTTPILFLTGRRTLP